MYGTINSKINSTPEGAYMPISQLNSILAVVNSLACNNLWLRYYVQVNSARLLECSFEMDKWTAFGLGVPFILLLSVYLILKNILV